MWEGLKSVRPLSSSANIQHENTHTQEPTIPRPKRSTNVANYDATPATGRDALTMNQMES